MKAPDKIYVHELSAKELAEPHSAYHVEYVNKDTLMEWAEKCKKIIEGSLRVKYDESLAIKGLMYAVFMDKINSL